MSFREIQVECYSGGRADERPRRLIIDGCVHIVARLLEESLEETSASTEQRRRFRLLTDEGVLLEVIRSGDGAWFLSSEPLETRA